MHWNYMTLFVCSKLVAACPSMSHRNCEVCDH
uniref:Uncharacterized protein n=1 Tax=Setaria viridis TaxID=4556 RepID=A0A4U6TQT9_SETVI|nr:hypothetical protein SEVIR_7G147003v2 [Setaria viridis]